MQYFMNSIQKYLFMYSAVIVLIFSVGCSAKSKEVIKPEPKVQTPLHEGLQNAFQELKNAKNTTDTQQKQQHLIKAHKALEQYQKNTNNVMPGDDCIKRAIYNLNNKFIDKADNNIKRGMIEIYHEIIKYDKGKNNPQIQQQHDQLMVSFNIHEDIGCSSPL